MVVVVFGGAAALVLPLGHVGAAVPAGVVLIAVAGVSAVVAGWLGGPGSGEAGERVTALGQVGEGHYP